MLPKTLYLYPNKDKIYLNQTYIISPNFFMHHFPPIFFDSQPFHSIGDHPHTYFSTPAVKSSSSTWPNELEFTAELGLPNEELVPFSEDKDEVLYNQSQEEHDEEEVWPISLITIVSPCFIPPHMQNFEESYFQDFEYGHSLDCEEVQHLMGTLFKGMFFLTK